MSTAVNGVAGLLVIRAILDNYEKSAPLMIAILSWMVFIPLFQLGTNKPIYAYLRERYVNGKIEKKSLYGFVKLLFYQKLWTFLVYVILPVTLYHRFTSEESFFDICIFFVGVASIFISSFQRDFLYSISLENMYEFLELVRKLALLGVYFFMGEIPLKIGGGILLLIAIFSLLVSFRYIYTFSLNECVDELNDRSIKLSGRPKLQLEKYIKYFVVSVNESGIYYLPIVFYTLISSDENILYYGIWIKLYVMLVIPMRIISDSRLNLSTKVFFTSNTVESWRILLVTLTMGGIVSIFAIGSFYFAHPHIFVWLNAEFMLKDSWLILSLSLWAFGNIIQHIYGSFALSHIDSVNMTLLISSVHLLLNTALLIIMDTLFPDGSVGLVLSIMGGIYIIMASFYLIHVRGLCLKND